MDRPDRIRPTPGYRPRSTRILPRPDFRPSNLHTRALSNGDLFTSVEAEWCPVCLGRQISERMSDGRPVWHCDTCGNEW